MSYKDQVRVPLKSSQGSYAPSYPHLRAKQFPGPEAAAQHEAHSRCLRELMGLNEMAGCVLHVSADFSPFPGPDPREALIWLLEMVFLSRKQFNKSSREKGKCYLGSFLSSFSEWRGCLRVFPP